MCAPVFIFSSERKAMYPTYSACGSSNMIEVSVAELSGAALNWAVAVATEARDIVFTKDSLTCGYQLADEVCWTNDYQPSSDWSQGGPMVESCSVTLAPYSVNKYGKPSKWIAEPRPDLEGSESGPTALIAACRAVVASKFGDTVSVPVELGTVAVKP